MPSFANSSVKVPRYSAVPTITLSQIYLALILLARSDAGALISCFIVEVGRIWPHYKHVERDSRILTMKRFLNFGADRKFGCGHLSNMAVLDLQLGEICEALALDVGEVVKPSTLKGPQEGSCAGFSDVFRDPSKQNTNTEGPPGWPTSCAQRQRITEKSSFPGPSASAVAIVMLPSSLLGLTASFLAPLIAATSAPTCTPNNNGFQVEKADFLYRNFCNDLASKGFPSTQQFFSLPWISFGFTAEAGGCTEDICNTNYGALINACGIKNDNVTGQGSVDAGCGIYNMTIWDADFVPGDNGTPSSIADVGTMTTGILHNAAATSIALLIQDSILGVTASSSPVPASSASPSSSQSLSSASSTSATVASTTLSSAAGSATTSSAVVSSVSVASNGTIISSGIYANTSVVLVTTKSQASVIWTTGTSIVTAGASGTAANPSASVSASLQGKSGADTVAVSGWSLLAVACVFGWFM
ncbi:hypothetical protein G7Y89_g2129 [Cudoniella acicularis]|uniref:Uncharacterized protein n=1 Tax=Cudoniella acicularis TaxID=354080 RepID=A0A8H4RTW9_9HELO|nr:hypothetical protein G7Y89_g2129 [Cudoniella acicularis]